MDEIAQRAIFRKVVATLMVASIFFGFSQLMGWIKV
jgi:hypothetical protein